jgi:uncharacterized protein YacL (UPF0231 family)
MARFKSFPHVCLWPLFLFTRTSEKDVRHVMMCLLNELVGAWISTEVDMAIVKVDKVIVKVAYEQCQVTFST